jgi:CubicO group peptidase (beta-lactamase class C family)
MDRRHFVAKLAGATLPLGAARLAFGRAPTSAPQWQELQKLLADYVGARKLAGAVVALADGGSSLTYLKAGRIALDADVLFDEHSVCRIYSMTKEVTGLAAMLLVEAGKLRLDQPVGDLVPELRTPQVALDPIKGLDARPATQTMTMRHLLTHSAGLAIGRRGRAPMRSRRSIAPAASRQATTARACCGPATGRKRLASTTW